MIFFPRLSLFLSLSSLSFLLFHSPCSEGWEIYNVGDYVAFSFFAKNPVIPPFLDFLSPDFLLFSFFFSPFPSLSSLQSSTVHGKRPCRALTRGRRNLLEANYSRPPLFRRVYRWNKFEKEGWSRGEFCWLTEETGPVCSTCNGDKVVMAITIGFFFSFFWVILRVESQGSNRLSRSCFIASRCEMGRPRTGRWLLAY